MNSITGLEKFSHLEDKIYRILEEHKALRQANENLTAELNLLRRQLAKMQEENDTLRLRLDRLHGDRDVMRMKVEAMLDAVSVFEVDAMEAFKK